MLLNLGQSTGMLNETKDMGWEIVDGEVVEKVSRYDVGGKSWDSDAVGFAVTG